jgi:glycopeptide antibiotics resistance protein
MLRTYLNVAIMDFISVVPIALVTFTILTVAIILFNRRFDFKPIIMVCEFAWVITVLMILKITGITGEYFGTTSFSQGIVNFSFSIFEDILSVATVLNVILFIPFGFLSAVVFKMLRKKWIYGVWLGMIFSGMIEFLQTFNGRYGGVQDILMNTIGTVIGYGTWFGFSRVKQIKSVK